MGIYGEGRPRKYTDNASKQRAYRARKAARQYQDEIECIRSNEQHEHKGYGISYVKWEIIKKLLLYGLIEKRPGFHMYRVATTEGEPHHD